ncbi:MAG: TraB/GumN family protein [Saprospiraceae bacterium]|nr:TraB/GumN family protein [Saprospiraceae bacterium]
MKRNTLLYRFYKNNDRVHYLFGTMHVGTKAAFSFTEIAKKYIDQVTLYAGEMDLNEAGQLSMMPYFQLEGDLTFSSLFRIKRYMKYRKTVLKSFGVDLADYEKFTPFFISNMLSQKILDDVEVMQSPDYYLWEYAMKSDKIMTGVESVNDQIGYLKRIPLEYQLKSFKDSMKNISGFRKQIFKLNDLYETADMKLMYQKTKKNLGEIRKMMLYERNLKMTEKIIDLTNENLSFISMGAAHLPGKKGVLKLLQNKGYQVEGIYF